MFHLVFFYLLGYPDVRIDEDLTKILPQVVIFLEWFGTLYSPRISPLLPCPPVVR